MTDKTNTPDEIVDVVNEVDEIIGQATKGEVNSNPKLIHREIAILIYDDHGKALIQQRSRHKKAFPGWWILSVAGHVPSGMSPLESAHKELIEELGFDTKLNIYSKELLDYGFEKHFAYGYIGKLPPNTQIKIDPYETEAFKFVSSEDMESMISQGEKFEEYSLRDLRKCFQGELDNFRANL